MVSLVGMILSRQSNDTADEANRKSDNANEIAQGANDLAQSANVYASEANVLSKQGVEVSQKDYENRYFPKITLRYGSRGDPTTTPPNEFILIGAANERYIPVLIDWIGYSIVGSQFTGPVFTVDFIQGRQPTLLPAEILPGRVLDIPIDFDSFRKSFQLNAKSLAGTHPAPTPSCPVTAAKASGRRKR